MTLFRPCIDLHAGRVKQIVGGSLGTQALRTNFVSQHGAAHYARLYQADRLLGGHVIMLGPGNDAEAQAALAAWPGGLQVGGGITAETARAWLARGAQKVIVTSWLFEGDELSQARLEQLAKVVRPSELVIDLSCRKREDAWYVATQRWQVVTRTRIDAELFRRLSPFASEFLIHAADVEGLCRGIDEPLVELLAGICDSPCTYAGGGRRIEDLDLVSRLSEGRVDLTFGSALDLFGGAGVRYADCVAYNRRVRASGP